MKVCRVKKTAFYDVFTGEGWKNWSRYKLDGEKLHHVSGNRIPFSILTSVQIKIALGV